ncbi:SPOSA6832_02935 [Sporobolomyces salmonicolor]|uniref:SPOSA6832_02935-mRNA-1:cds n=1 Tax=Sporidiobolus salmonicolor TaxID=5005 RepID=A0A0D6EMI2_SPOSA|nr:SPOSA6832_02935 [Sporobolomyces salmonicolor]
MGNDGGSIPKRDDLVRTKKKRSREDDKDRVRQLWSFCALSKQPLRQPVVSCPLGKLYNKEAVISYLLNPPSSSETSPFGSDGLLVASHIRSLKDVTTLRLTPNPALPNASDQQDEAAHLGGSHESNPPAQFVCPISLREMNGSVKFMYRKPCGCVMSEAALKEMRRGQEKKGEADQRELTDEQVCPVDGERSDKPEEWVTLNPKEDELETMKLAWEAKKLREKEGKKKAKVAKRKGGAGEANGDELAKAKKQKTDKNGLTTATVAPAVKAGASIPHLQATLAAKLAEQKKQQSPAIASLYRDKNQDDTRDKDGRSTWMTRGAYARF